VSFRRLAVAIFVSHIAGTLIIGYLLIPDFRTTVQPPPAPPFYATLIRGVISFFYFPVISWACDALITPISQPGLCYVVANSGLVAVVISVVVVVALAQRRTHAVA
jgi:hypothetical protein